MTAVIIAAGKQYVVATGQKVKIEKLAGDAGQMVVFDQVLLTSDGTTSQIGTPTLAQASVSAQIVTQGRLPKVTAVRYKNKTRSYKTRGHRQAFTEVKIGQITV